MCSGFVLWGGEGCEGFTPVAVDPRAMSKCHDSKASEEKRNVTRGKEDGTSWLRGSRVKRFEARDDTERERERELRKGGRESERES